MTLQDIIGDYDTFLRIVLTEAKSAGFEFQDFVQIDHLAYRTISQHNYAAKKAGLSHVGKLLGEHMINSRPTATFRLHKPIRFSGWRIDTVELPAPKPGSKRPEGLEHIEFVLFDDLEAFMQKYPHLSFDTSPLANRVNPHVNFLLPSGFAVKFHLLSLPAVIYLEDKLGITN